MKAKKLFYKECHLAGRMYYDVNEVWDELKIGTLLQLVRDADNHYDPRAVAVMYKRPATEEQEAETFILGYIPHNDNELLAGFLDMGWEQLFECRISSLKPDAHYESQIRLTLRIRRNEAETN